MKNHPEGAYFTIDDSGLMLIYNYRMPTEKELSAVKEGNPAEFRFLTENGMIFFMSKMGSLPWNDSPFDPRLERDHGLELPVSESAGYLMRHWVRKVNGAGIVSVIPINTNRKNT